MVTTESRINKVVVQSGLDSLGQDLCGDTVVCSGDIVHDLQTVISNTITSPIHITVQPQQQQQLSQATAEEEKLGLLEQTSSTKVMNDFTDLFEFDKILANNDYTADSFLEHKWNDMDILFPDLD